MNFPTTLDAIRMAMITRTYESAQVSPFIYTYRNVQLLGYLLVITNVIPLRAYLETAFCDHSYNRKLPRILSYSTQVVSWLDLPEY